MRAVNLCLHAGAASCSRASVLAVPTPERTRSWVPISHGRFIEGVVGLLEATGLAIASEAHALSRHGDRYFGLLQVAGNDGADHALVVGLRNSHDKSFPAGLVIGAQVFVCDNLAFSGEVRLSRKHTAQVERDLPNLIERACGKLGDLRRTQEERYSAYKATELTDLQAHDLVVRAYDTGALPVTRIPDVLHHWREPPHQEFIDAGKTAWRWFNALTEALKGSGLASLPDRTIALHGLLDAACGLHFAQAV